ncbi:MAG: hypothetical protein M3T96_08520 [Acidobacteriota bacterium]|nr:hypothetical protein [Acidobacteriota bacterium]
MKICPRCQKTYGDENLNFCLDDGATLMRTDIAADAVPPTVMINQPRPTGQPFGNQGAAQPNWSAPPQFSTPSPPSLPPPKKSKAWLWALGILGGLMLICGGGVVGFIFWAASLDNNDSNRSQANIANHNSAPVNKNRSVVNTNSDPTLNSAAHKIDLSDWVKGDTDAGMTEYSDDELLMSSKGKNFYYVVLALATDKTENAVTRVSVKNINEEKTSLGFGLVVNSNPKPLTQDYALLIDSENKKFRIVRHSPDKEVAVVGWTRSPVIKDGTQENVLEVRDADETMSFYINGEFVRTIPNTDGYSGGIVGLYAGDAVQIAFSDLEISK